MKNNVHLKAAQSKGYKNGKDNIDTNIKEDYYGNWDS